MVGASPPASGLLRDKPTLDALNAMGIDVGTLGNHEFDRGVTGDAPPGQRRPVHDRPVDHLRQAELPGGGRERHQRRDRQAAAPAVRHQEHRRRPGRVHRRDHDHHADDRHHRRHRPACTSSTRRPPSTASSRSSQHQGVHAFVAVIHEGGVQSTYPVGHGRRPDQHDRARTSTRPCPCVISGHSHTVVDTRVGEHAGDPGVLLHPGLRRHPPADGPAGTARSPRPGARSSRSGRTRRRCRPIRRRRR